MSDKSGGRAPLLAARAAATRAENKAKASRYRVLAVGKTDDGKPIYVLPISGKGLWSTLYGFLALEGDANTVRGITFYQHGETPGLGGEVDNPQWQAAWKGKTILDDKGGLVSVTVKKAKIDPSIPAEKHHYVDGLSGATITSTSSVSSVSTSAYSSVVPSVSRSSGIMGSTTSPSGT